MNYYKRGVAARAIAAAKRLGPVFVEDMKAFAAPNMIPCVYASVPQAKNESEFKRTPEQRQRMSAAQQKRHARARNK